MATRPIRGETRTYIAIAVISAVFLAGNVVADFQLARIDHAADLIATAAAPSVEELAVVRGGTRDVVFLLDNYVDGVGDDPAKTLAAMRNSRSRTDEAVAIYLALPVLPGEPPLQRELVERKFEFDRQLDRALGLAASGQRGEARAAVDGEVRRAADGVVDAAMQILALDVSVGSELAREMKHSRRAAETTVAVTCAFAIALAAFAAFVVHRALGRERAFDEARREELESFAARVSHDLRGPLSTLSLSLDLAERAEDESRRGEAFARGRRVIGQATMLIDDLLGFAVAGAKPIPGASVEAGPALAELVESVRPKADAARIALALEPPPPAKVACTAGVFLSVASNLVENAIKYMGDAPIRKIVIGVTVARVDRIRITVRDTGGGVPPELGRSAFNPWVRGKSTSQPGIGLGLATVKRLVEAHGGAVGFESTEGEGSAFWFELPTAGARATDFWQSAGPRPA